MKTSFLLFFILNSFVFNFNQSSFTGFLSANTKQNSEENIDSLIEDAKQLYIDENYKEAFKIYTQVLEKSKQANYSKGLVSAYLGYSGIYFIQSKLDSSTHYLIKAKEEPYAKNNFDILYSIAFREGLNLHSIGLYDEAIEYYKEALTYTFKFKNDEERINYIDRVYINLGDIYQLQNKVDSALYYYKSAYNSPVINFENKFTSSVSISDLHIEKSELDSAEVYLNFAEYYAQKLNTDYSKSILNEVKAKHLKSKGKFEKAIELFQNSLVLNKQLKRSKPELYKFISDTYDSKGNKELSNFYLRKYVEKKDSLELANIGNMKVPMILAQTQNVNQLEKVESSNKSIMIISLLLIFSAFSITYFYIKKLRKKRIKGREENLRLKKKLNLAFEEVVELAESNSPNFLSRFIEVYPEFYNQLITEYPDLTTADIKLCALLKLNYTTKEIAEITFCSVRTVQNRMYRIRKKINLPSEERLNRWVQNLHVHTLSNIEG